MSNALHPLFESPQEALACALAEFYHYGQKRKYTGEPYHNHCREVAETVKSVHHSSDMVLAAWLHDTKEDTNIPATVIWTLFGKTVNFYVDCLTHVVAPSLRRAERKLLDRTVLGSSPEEVQTIKLADMLSNTPSIVTYDPKFAEVYLPEMRKLWEALTKGDVGLMEAVDQELRKVGY
jgi:(p)ppGpp synthase/HD superfamily hydrolase